MTFRDLTVVIIETSRTSLNACHGLHELLKVPSVEVRARVGIRRSALEDASNGNAKIPAASCSQASSLPQFSIPNATVNDYLVGSQLDEALSAGQDLAISWPFANGDVIDWVQAESLWKYVLFKQLGLRRVQNESPVLLSIAAGLPRSSYERICQIFFERFNVAGFSILERPMSQIYATNSLSGIVVDVGHEITDITPIYDGFILHAGRTTVAIGVQDCQNYLANILKTNQSVTSALSPPESPLSSENLHATLIDLVKHIWELGHIKIHSSGENVIEEDEGVTDIAAILVAGKEKAVIESGMKKKATAKATAAEQARAREIEALDLITIEFRGHSLTLGKERHRFCEPLFDPTLMNKVPGSEHRALSLPIQDAVGHAVRVAEVDQRQYIWGGLFLTGELTKHIKGIGIALQSRLAPYIVSNPDLQTDVQARSIRVLSVPEYYPEYRDTGDGYAAFLGASIISKITFSSNQNYVSKTEYTTTGPRSVIQNSPALI